MDMLRGGWGPGMMGNGQGTVGAGSSYDAATEAIAAAFTTPPTTGRKDLIDAAVVALKSAGVWTKLDALYLFAAADRQAAIINWKAPGTFNCTEVGSPTFTADQGFTGASTKYLDSNFNPTTATTPQFTQNSASAFGWSLTDIDQNTGLFGYDTGPRLQLVPRTGNTAYFSINSDAFPSAANTNSTGFYLGARVSATATLGYKNGAQIYTSSPEASAVVNNESIDFLRRQATFWTGQIAAGGIGSALDATQQLALYNALRTYLTGVGVP